MDNHRDNVASAIYENIHEAILSGNLDAVQKFVQQGIDINAISISYGGTALLLAVQENQMSVVHYLLQHGADPNLRDGVWGFGDTPLHQALHERNPTAVFILLNHAEINITIKNSLFKRIPSQLLIENFIQEKNLNELALREAKPANLRCLYAFLLKGIDVMKPELFDNDYLKAFRPKMKLIVEEAKAYIAKVKEEFGMLGTPFVFHILLSSPEERREFSATWFWLQTIMKRYNAIKNLKSGQWPLELSMQVYKLLLENNADELFSFKINTKLPAIEEESPQRRLGF